jgi:hypothetical protein
LETVGRQSVKVRRPCHNVGAGERAATSENDMKNARIEANSDETQADEGQEGRTRDPDSGGENRSQLSDRSDVAW